MPLLWESSAVLGGVLSLQRALRIGANNRVQANPTGPLLKYRFQGHFLDSLGFWGPGICTSRCSWQDSGVECRWRAGREGQRGAFHQVFLVLIQPMPSGVPVLFSLDRGSSC